MLGIDQDKAKDLSRWIRRSISGLEHGGRSSASARTAAGESACTKNPNYRLRTFSTLSQRTQRAHTAGRIDRREPRPTLPCQEFGPVHFDRFCFVRFFFGPVACAPGFGMDAVGFTRSARRIASSSRSGMCTVSPGFGICISY